MFDSRIHKLALGISEDTVEEACVTNKPWCHLYGMGGHPRVFGAGDAGKVEDDKCQSSNSGILHGHQQASPIVQDSPDACGA